MGGSNPAYKVQNMSFEQIGDNVEYKVENEILIIKINTTKRFGRSSSGKTEIVASTRGNPKVYKNIQLGINCFTK